MQYPSPLIRVNTMARSGVIATLCRAALVLAGLECSGQGYGGPYTFENNAVQANNSALPSSSGVTTSANLYKGSGLIDTSTGYLHVVLLVIPRHGWMRRSP